MREQGEEFRTVSWALTLEVWLAESLPSELSALIMLTSRMSLRFLYQDVPAR